MRGRVILGVLAQDRCTGMAVWVSAYSRPQSWLDQMLTGVVPGDKGALLSGLVTGRDDALSDERKEAFRNTGTSHITAISGSNLALLVTIATLSGRFLGLRRRRSWQIGLIVALWGYALLTGFNLPVGRAAACGHRAGRRRNVRPAERRVDAAGARWCGDGGSRTGRPVVAVVPVVYGGLGSPCGSAG